MSLQNETTDKADRTFVSSRIIDVPQEKVFEAVRNPELLGRWWGPEGFTNTFETFDLRPGGIWEFVMHGPNGVDYPNKSVFVEIAAPERIVFDHVYAPVFRMTITCEQAEQGAKTRFGFHMVFETAEIYQQLLPVITPANEQNFDRLEAVLASF